MLPAKSTSDTIARMISAAAGTSVGGKAEERVNPAVGGLALNQREQFAYLAHLQVEAIPQHARIAAAGDVPLNLLARHERRLFVLLRVADAGGRKAAAGQLHRPAPIPRGFERGQFLADRVGAHLAGTGIDVALQCRRRQLTKRKAIAEHAASVVQVDADGVEAVCLNRAVAERGEVAIFQVRERDRLARRFRQRRLICRRRAVELHEGNDVDAGRELDQPLLEAHQQVFHLLRLAFGFVL
ncbi:MAG: hypothetical protein U0746_02780 [Gemmataceae bacterium]